MVARPGTHTAFKAKWNLIFTYLYLIAAIPAQSVVSVERNGNALRNPLSPGGHIHRNCRKSTCFLASTRTEWARGTEGTSAGFCAQENFPGLSRELQLRAYNYTHNRNPGSRQGYWSSYYNRNSTNMGRPAVANVAQQRRYQPFQQYNSQPRGFFDPSMRTGAHPGFGPLNFNPGMPYYGTQFVPFPAGGYQPGVYPAGGYAPAHYAPMGTGYPAPLNQFATPRAQYQAGTGAVPAVDTQVGRSGGAEEDGLVNRSSMPNEMVYWNKKKLRDEMKMMKYSSFKFYTDVTWWNDEADEWPGTNKIKPGEVYEGVIHYYFTPYDALVLLVDQRVEGSVSLEDLPPAFLKTTIKDAFKIDHLIRLKLKEPFEFDEKGRPKFVPCLECFKKKRRYEFRSRVRGTPIFFTNTMAVFKLEDGENYAQVFLVNTGVYLTFPIEYKMIQFFQKGEVVEMEVLKGPTEPRATGYLCRIPFDSAKGAEFRQKYKMIFDMIPKDSEAAGAEGDKAPSQTASAEAEAETRPQERYYVNEYDKFIPFESELLTLKEFVKRMGADLKVVLGYIALRTKSNVSPSGLVSPTMAKMLVNFLKGRNVYHVDPAEEDAEFNQFIENSESFVNERNPVVAILGGPGEGKSTLFSSLCGLEPDPESNFNFGRVKAELPITLFDTPGNELLGPIRDNILRGADMALVLISSETGVTRSALEAIRKCRSMGKPFILVLSKFDRSTQTTVDEAMARLSEEGVQVEQMGGSQQMVVFSSTQDAETNRENLLQAIILESSVSDALVSVSGDDLKADGYVLDSGKSKAQGFYALLLVRNGAVEKGDFLVSNLQRVKVKSLRDAQGNALEKLGASETGYVYGFDRESIPDPGTEFQAFKTEEDADKMSQVNRIHRSQEELSRGIGAKMEESLREIDQNEAEGVKQVPVVVRCDVKALVEAVRVAIEGLKCVGFTTTARFKVVDGDIGALTLEDTEVLGNSGLVVAHRTPVSNTLKNKLNKAGLQLVAEESIDDVVARAREKLEEYLGEKKLGRLMGRAEILKVFEASKKRNAAGCVVTHGRIQPFHEVRVLRGGRVVFHGGIGSLRRTTEEADEILETESCGITFQDFNDFKVGDLIESYVD